VSQYLLAFLTAIIGVLGTGIGVLAAFVPTELIGKRDYFERLAKFWALLQFEVERIIIYSDKFHDLSTGNNPQIDTTLSPISLAAWNAAYANSEFIVAADPVLIRNIAASYVLLERLNAAVENYKLFCATATMATIPNFGERVRGLHQEMQYEADIVRAEFESCQSSIPRHVQLYQRRAKSKQQLIIGLSIFAVTIFSATIGACVILGILLSRSG
jgi:hypothetical protein